jgi:hypothetical protein
MKPASNVPNPVSPSKGNTEAVCGSCALFDAVPFWLWAAELAASEPELAPAAV